MLGVYYINAELQSAEAAVAKFWAPDSLSRAVLNKIFITADARLPDDSQRRCRFQDAANEICAVARPYSTNYSYLHGRIKRKSRGGGFALSTCETNEARLLLTLLWCF